MADTVAEAHPEVQTSRGITRSGGRVYFYSRPRTPEDDEDLDALPVEEQAAIMCAIFASDVGTEADLDHPADLMAWDVWQDAPYTGGGADCVRDEWAEAEARIRNGEVRR